MSKLIRLNELDRYKFDSPPEIFVYLLEHAIDWRRIRHSNILYTDGEGLSIAYKYFDINGKLSGFKIRDLLHGGKYSVTYDANKILPFGISRPEGNINNTLMICEGEIDTIHLHSNSED